MAATYVYLNGTYSTMATLSYSDLDPDDLSFQVGQNATELGDAPINITVATIFLIIALIAIILGTIFGNALTLTALSQHRPLQTAPNCLIASLAVADLMVAILVMPLSLSSEVAVIWMFGPALCEAWLSLDVLCCTASILSLCMISLDRFWAITKPIMYPKYRTRRTMFILIGVVWFLSALISTSPLFGWRSSQDLTPQTCNISQNITYTFISTFGAFFIPMTIMMIVYARIFCEARKRIRGGKFQRTASPTFYMDVQSCYRSVPYNTAKTCHIVVNETQSDHNQLEIRNSASITSSCNLVKSVPNLQNGCSNDSKEDQTQGPGRTSNLLVPAQGGANMASVSLQEINGNGKTSSAEQSLIPMSSSFPSQLQERERKRRAMVSAREHRATKTLGIVTGVFLVCWLPFFLRALILPLCGESCSLPRIWDSMFLWLGYFNSMLNPIIYTKFNRDFQKAFKKLLRCKAKKMP